MTKLSVRWEGHVTVLWEMSYALKDLFGKPVAKIPFERPRHVMGRRY
jgi:hypothetical protein